MKPMTKTSPLKRATKAGMDSMTIKGQQYVTPDGPFLCHFCSHDRFTLGISIPLLLMRQLICSNCGQVGLFKGKVPKALKE